MALRFGIDLGGTKTEGVILDAEGREMLRERIATDAAGYEPVLGGIDGSIAGWSARRDGAPHTLGIGTPGAVSRRTGPPEELEHHLPERDAGRARPARAARRVTLRSRTTPTASRSPKRSPARAGGTASCSA